MKINDNKKNRCTATNGTHIAYANKCEQTWTHGTHIAWAKQMQTNVNKCKQMERKLHEQNKCLLVFNCGTHVA